MQFDELVTVLLQLLALALQCVVVVVDASPKLVELCSLVSAESLVKVFVTDVSVVSNECKFDDANSDKIII